MYLGKYYIAAQEVTSNYVYVLYYILCVDKDYIFSKINFIQLACVLLASPRFHASVQYYRSRLDGSLFFAGHRSSLTFLTIYMICAH
jgi:hypothetical protein